MMLPEGGMAGVDMAPTVFGRSVSNQGGWIMPTTLLLAPPDVWTLRCLCYTIAAMPSLLCRLQILVGLEFGQSILTVVHTVR